MRDAGTKGGCIELIISDDGDGIPAADVPRVFDRGFTGSKGRAHHKATGMGLYLAAVACERMGLGLCISSEEGVGTTITLTFPLDRTRMDLGEPSRRPSQTAIRPRAAVGVYGDEPYNIVSLR